MPIYTVQGPDNRVYTIEGPEGATAEQLGAHISSNAQPVPPATSSKKNSTNAPLNWSDIPGQALSNIPSSAGNVLSGIGHAVMHPIDTAGNILDIGAGALRNALPKGVASAIDKLDWNPQAAQQATNAADTAGQFFKDRYGSTEGLKNTLATDPVGALMDASAVLTGGGTAAAKIPILANTGGKAVQLGRMLDPLAGSVNLVAKGTQKAGGLVADVVGGLGTHTGGEGLKHGAMAGFEGGQQAKSFADNMRGNVPMTDVLESAKSNLEQMGRDRGLAYRQGMAKVSGDSAILGFDGIDQAVKNAADMVSYKGQVKSVKAAEVQQKIAAEIAQWKSLDPLEFHTPEGLDALKQKIGAIVEGVPYEEATARKVGNGVYHAIKDEIVKQAPVYADTMKGYSEASDQIKEIERALSLGNKASADTSMRKLQSLMRNNANTNYGNRLDLAKQLVQQGGSNIMPALAGQSLSTWTPRGIGSALAGASGVGGYALGGPALATAVLAAQSPRLMGETSLKLGQLAGLAKAGSELPNKVGINPRLLSQALYQYGRLNQE